MLSCLRTGDQQSAHLCLERLSSRFGSENERVMALRGLYHEAIAEDDVALKRVMDEYDSILEADPSNMVCGSPIYYIVFDYEAKIF
jgi:alpha-D-ribose 1-methylphosphonate 5-triphosphate synthase subunit PhnI